MMTVTCELIRSEPDIYEGDVLKVCPRYEEFIEDEEIQEEKT